ncbi:DoxX family protein [uncultured Tistrella sp.]|uniref:DoxX family protein n=1 Tax=Tistrella mobilis TaxID=171437 RepID=UPI000C0A9960|nr:DoxX family protein [uncultured Tistrella sp.]MAM73931.1 DoxX family protein [Tistrella sp.]
MTHTDHQGRQPAPRLILPALGPVYAGGTPLAGAALRIAFGLTMVTHGLPKLLGSSHGSMADPMAGSTGLIRNVLGLPFAEELAMLVTLLETFGGLALAAGLATRLIAVMFTIEMIAISVALGPTWPWIDRGIEYPVMLGFTALLFAFTGGGRLSLDRRLGLEI